MISVTVHLEYGSKDGPLTRDGILLPAVPSIGSLLEFGGVRGELPLLVLITGVLFFANSNEVRLNAVIEKSQCGTWLETSSVEARENWITKFEFQQ